MFVRLFVSAVEEEVDSRERERECVCVCVCVCACACTRTCVHARMCMQCDITFAYGFLYVRAFLYHLSVFTYSMDECVFSCFLFLFFHAAVTKPMTTNHNTS